MANSMKTIETIKVGYLVQNLIFAFKKFEFFAQNQQDHA
jgi:hypothetical protein